MYRRYKCQATAIAGSLYRALDSDFSKQALGHLERGEFHELVSLKVDPSTYRDAANFRDDYLVAELMSKFPSWNIGIDRQKVAIAAFTAAEMSCFETNLRLARSYGTASTTVSFASYLYTARRKIARVLGPFSWDLAEQFFGFGPGATFHLKRKYGDAYYKFGSTPEVTKGCAALAYTAIRRVPGWYHHLVSSFGEQESFGVLKITEGNRITTVPKNAKTDRVIAIEPLMNMFIQKGIGGLIRKRLRRVGIDLDDQQPNQRLALEGSKTDKLATVDLSAASDTISYRLVEELLPDDWFRAIEQARSPVGILPDGTKLTYHKVSSMGNGFTFELESLIFWGLCEAVLEFHGDGERRLLVYGDDIVIASSVYEPLCKLLSFCGFTVNPKKSFSSGPFRESCGKHYFNGSDVTPFYIRKDVVSTDALLLTLNNLRRFASRGMAWGLDGRLKPVYEEFRSKLPQYFRKPRISDGFGDNALFGDFDEVCPRRAPWGECGFSVEMPVFVRRSYEPVDVPFLLKGLYQLERRDVSPCRLWPAGGQHPVIRMLALDNLKRSTGGPDVPLAVELQGDRGNWRMTKFTIPQWVDKGEWL